MIKQFYIHKNNAIKLAFAVLLFFAAGMQSVKAQNFVNWSVTPTNGAVLSGTGAFTGGTVTLSQSGDPSSISLKKSLPTYLNLNGAAGNEAFSSAGPSSPNNTSKSLVFTFSTPVIINELNINDIDRSQNIWDDSFDFSGVTFTSVTGVLCAPTTTGVTVTSPALSTFPDPPNPDAGSGVEYARWITSTTPVTSFTINYRVTLKPPGFTGTVTTAELSYSMKVSLPPCFITPATAGTNTQTVNAGTAITPIVYNLGTATGATISPALPAGLVGTYNAGAKTYTISGTPSSSTVYNYTVTATGTGCTGTGTITVNAVTTNSCPVATVDLATHTSGVAPTGSTLKWFKATDLITPIANPGAVGAGTYYAAYVANDNSCRSPFSAGVVVTIIDCPCYNDPNTTVGTATPTLIGITLLKRAGAENGNWPGIRKGGFTALESNNKGFVVTRMSTVEIEGQASPLIAPKITTPQEGMMIYDTTAKCLKLYDGTAWSCFNTPACP